jgi:hypothetical protein
MGAERIVGHQKRWRQELGRLSLARQPEELLPERGVL